MINIALYHIKGGVGKTATAVNLSYVAAQSGIRTLVCDLDPQGSTTFYLRIRPKFKSGAKGLAKGGKRIDRNIKGTDYDNLDLLPADFSYRNLDIALAKAKDPKVRLNAVLKRLEREYECLFLDCPPNVNIVAENVFTAADYIIVPVVPTSLSQKSHELLMNFFKKKRFDRAKLVPFFSMVEPRKKMHRDIMMTMRERHPGILSATIPYMAEIEKMGFHREPVAAYAPDSRAAAAYECLWQEISVIVAAPGMQR